MNDIEIEVKNFVEQMLHHNKTWQPRQRVYSKNKFKKLKKESFQSYVQYKETPKSDSIFGYYYIAKLPKRYSRKQRQYIVKLLKPQVFPIIRLIRRENMEIARKLFGVETLHPVKTRVFKEEVEKS